MVDKKVFKKKIKALVFGGSGFLGSHVAEVLSKRGYSVTVADLKKPSYFKKNIKFKKIDITNEKKMFELYKQFQSVKPSMWVDKENNRDLELDQICGVVISNCEKLGVDAPYTRTISTLLDFTYNKKRK